MKPLDLENFPGLELQFISAASSFLFFFFSFFSFLIICKNLFFPLPTLYRQPDGPLCSDL